MSKRTEHLQSNYSKKLSESQLIASESFGVPSSRSEESLLGTTTKSASTPENIDVQTSLIQKFDNNENRYALQKIAQKLLPNHRICACMKTVSPQKQAVEVVYSDENQHAHYRNLMRCDSVWLCPVCSGRISSRRAEEIRQGYANAVDKLGYRVVMVTYTMQHSSYHELLESVNAMREARRQMRSGRAWQKFKKQYGYTGCISALEVTWSSDSGWHVHVHEIVFLNPDLADFELHPDAEKLKKWLHSELSPRWQESCEKVGRSASFEHGLQVDTTDEYVTEYVSKHGHLPESVSWDIASEIAQGNRKISKGGLHPFQILELSDSPELTEAQRNVYKALWYEYVDAFNGKRQIYWTSGLKDLISVDVIEDDADIEETGDVIFLIAREMWQDIVYMDKRAELLNKTILWRADGERINKYFAEVAAQAHKKRWNRDHWRKT